MIELSFLDILFLLSFTFYPENALTYLTRLNHTKQFSTKRQTHHKLLKEFPRNTLVK